MQADRRMSTPTYFFFANKCKTHSGLSQKESRTGDHLQKRQQISALHVTWMHLAPLLSYNLYPHTVFLPSLQRRTKHIGYIFFFSTWFHSLYIVPYNSWVYLELSLQCMHNICCWLVIIRWRILTLGAHSQVVKWMIICASSPGVSDIYLNFK